MLDFQTKFYFLWFISIFFVLILFSLIPFHFLWFISIFLDSILYSLIQFYFMWFNSISIYTVLFSLIQFYFPWFYFIFFVSFWFSYILRKKMNSIFYDSILFSMIQIFSILESIFPLSSLKFFSTIKEKQ